MPKVTRRAVKVAPTRESLEPLVTEFNTHRTMARLIVDRLDAVKARLMATLERHGVKDERGSLWIHFDEPIGDIKAIKRERRSILKLDEVRAEGILRDRGRYDECVDVDLTFNADSFDKVVNCLKSAGIYDEVVTTTERLSDDKIMQLYFAEKQLAEEENREPVITDDDIDAMFVETVTWAFITK